MTFNVIATTRFGQVGLPSLIASSPTTDAWVYRTSSSSDLSLLSETGILRTPFLSAPINTPRPTTSGEPPRPSTSPPPPTSNTR